MRVLKIKLYEIGVSRSIIYDFFSIINEIILLVYGNILAIVTTHLTTDWPFVIWPITSFLRNIVDHTVFADQVNDYISLVHQFGVTLSSVG